MITTITGIRQKAPEFWVSNAWRDWGRTIIAVDFGGATRLVHIFTTWIAGWTEANLRNNA